MRQWLVRVPNRVREEDPWRRSVAERVKTTGTITSMTPTCNITTVQRRCKAITRSPSPVRTTRTAQSRPPPHPRPGRLGATPREAIPHTTNRFSTSSPSSRSTSSMDLSMVIAISSRLIIIITITTTANITIPSRVINYLAAIRTPSYNREPRPRTSSQVAATRRTEPPLAMARVPRPHPSSPT